MPQMMPMKWLYLFYLFLLLFSIMMSMIYFTNSIHPLSIHPSHPHLINNILWNWKW